VINFVADFVALYGRLGPYHIESMVGVAGFADLARDH
jgi:hypothetical protein